MGSFIRRRSPTSVMLTGLLSGALLLGCASLPRMAEKSMPAGGGSAPASENEVSPAADTTGAAIAQVPKTAPQLIKKAELSLTVDSIAEALQSASTAIKNQQGDMLGLQDQVPRSDRTRHFATLEIRVPQAKLEPLLAELAKLGTVQTRSIQAEDVSAQLVDFEARLRNLRKTEQTLLKIMERSGSVGDVLKVAQEVSQTRETIEQISAQLENLKNQVAYSTITLRLEQAVSTTPPQTPLGSQFQETWGQATHSVSSLTIGLLKLGVWLIAYTPYLLILAAAGVLLLRTRRRRTTPVAETPTPRSPENEF